MKPYWDAMSDASREYLLKLLRETQWNYAHAAQLAGVNRSHLYVLLRRAGIQRPMDRRRLNPGNAAWQSLGH